MVLQVTLLISQSALTTTFEPVPGTKDVIYCREPMPSTHRAHTQYLPSLLGGSRALSPGRISSRC